MVRWHISWSVQVEMSSSIMTCIKQSDRCQIVKLTCDGPADYESPHTLCQTSQLQQQCWPGMGTKHTALAAARSSPFHRMSAQQLIEKYLLRPLRGYGMFAILSCKEGSNLQYDIDGIKIPVCWCSHQSTIAHQDIGYL